MFGTHGTFAAALLFVLERFVVPTFVRGGFNVGRGAVALRERPPRPLHPIASLDRYSFGKESIGTMMWA